MRNKELTPVEAEAIEWYVSGYGLWINQYLRGNEQLAPLIPVEEEMLGGLDSVTDNYLEGYTKLYRSVDAEVLLGKMTFQEYDALRYILSKGEHSPITDNAIGKEMTEKGFMSTTVDLGTAFGWGALTGASKPLLIEFTVPTGIKGYDLTDHPMNQNEVLLKRGQRYRIDRITFKEKNIYVYATLLSRRVAKTFYEIMK